MKSTAYFFFKNDKEIGNIEAKFITIKKLVNLCLLFVTSRSPQRGW
jgi:hypothetical protein